MKVRHALRGFIIGSSLPATIWPLVGLGFESRHLAGGTLNWLLIGLFFPALFGLTNALTVTLPGQKNPAPNARGRRCNGARKRIEGTFILNIPEIVYGLQGNNRYLALPACAIFYALVWAFPVRWMNKLFSTDVH